MESLNEVQNNTVDILFKDIFPLLRNDKTSLFLIGASTKSSDSLRGSLRNELGKHRKRYDIYYPEEIFSDLLYTGKTDLLSLENLLAASVSAVVICLESNGSIAELGAFVNHRILSKKLIVIVDIKHKKANSFIRKGPIRFLETKNNPNPILWFDYKNGNMFDLSIKLRILINKVASKNPVKKSLQNLIVVEDFLLLLIYILGPLLEKDLISYIHNLKPSKTIKTETICLSGLGTLFNQKQVILENNNYSLTRSGFKRLIDSLPQKNRSFTISVIDDLRVNYLDKLLRKC